MEDNTVIVGVFYERAQADQAMWDLQKAGFRDIGFVVRDDMTTQSLPSLTEKDEDVGKHSHRIATDAVAGGIIGGVVGAAVALLIAGLGSVIAGGIITTTLGGVVLGAATGGLIGVLRDLGVSEEVARRYEDEVRSGRTIVIVQADDRPLEAFRILERYQPINRDDYLHLDHSEPDPEATVELKEIDVEPE